MLRRLIIRNVAILDQVDLEFGPGMTVLSGETGAGKSMILGALTLVLGGRASPDLIRAGCDEAVAAAEFSLDDTNRLPSRLRELGLDLGSDLLLRRIIQSGGRSRAFVNDQPVTAALLSQIGRELVDISGQHQHQSLLQPEAHLDLLDRFGGLSPEREAVAERVRAYHLARRERDALSAKRDQRLDREEILRHHLDELRKASPQPGEIDRLNQERTLRRHAEKIAQGTAAVSEWLSGEDRTLSSLARAERELERLADWLPDAADMARRLASARIDIEDVLRSIEALHERAEADPARLEEIETRLAQLQRLLRKHGPTEAEMFESVERMGAELMQLEDFEGTLEALNARLERARHQAVQASHALSKARRKAAHDFGSRVEEELRDLGMPKARFLVDLEIRPDGEPTEQGLDLAEFLIAPNIGEDPKPLRHTASGGELSRVMLAVKGVLLDRDPVMVSVFDEADAGIGGAVAVRVGARIKALSKARPTLVITHLPQIAAFADRHILVEKQERDGRTVVTAVPLNQAGRREQEIARMMAGESAGPSAVKAARDLISKSKGV